VTVRSLVLGGSVFVGRTLVRALATAGHDVAVLNRGKTPTELPPGVSQLVADRTDRASMEGALRGTEWDEIYDVSGFVMAAGGSDIDGLLDLVEGRVGHYVYVSSIMAYDQSLAGVFPWTEDMPANPEGTASYGGFKAVVEAAMLARHAERGFPATIVRPAAIYGPDNNIYDMETPMWLRLRQHRPILMPHGGLVTGSYGHVEDLCDAMRTLARSPGSVGRVYNVTTDGITVQRYVDTLASIVGVEPVIVPVPDRELARLSRPVFGHLFGVRHHALISTERLRTDTGLTPRFDFRSGHEQTYEWFLAQGWADLAAPLADPVWRSSWDFDAEADFAARLSSTPAGA